MSTLAEFICTKLKLREDQTNTWACFTSCQTDPQMSEIKYLNNEHVIQYTDKLKPNFPIKKIFKIWIKTNTTMIDRHSSFSTFR